MSALEQIRALFNYNEWANGHVLNAASSLTQEELERKLAASFDSVQGNLWHIVTAQRVWLARFTSGNPDRLPPIKAGLTLDAIRQAYRDSHTGLHVFIVTLTEDDLARVLSYTDTLGERQERVLWQTMLQVVNHGTHHRAETALLLTSLGTPPRQLDYLFFEIEQAGGKPRIDR